MNFEDLLSSIQNSYIRIGMYAFTLRSCRSSTLCRSNIFHMGMKVDEVTTSTKSVSSA